MLEEKQHNTLQARNIAFKEVVQDEEKSNSKIPQADVPLVLVLQRQCAGVFLFPIAPERPDIGTCRTRPVYKKGQMYSTLRFKRLSLLR